MHKNDLFNTVIEECGEVLNDGHRLLPMRDETIEEYNERRTKLVALGANFDTKSLPYGRKLDVGKLKNILLEKPTVMGGYVRDLQKRISKLMDTYDDAAYQKFTVKQKIQADLLVTDLTTAFEGLMVIYTGRDIPQASCPKDDDDVFLEGPQQTGVRKEPSFRACDVPIAESKPRKTKSAKKQCNSGDSPAVKKTDTAVASAQNATAPEIARYARICEKDAAIASLVRECFVKIIDILSPPKK